jgi:hypothetical protein
LGACPQSKNAMELAGSIFLCGHRAFRCNLFALEKKQIGKQKGFALQSLARGGENSSFLLSGITVVNIAPLKGCDTICNYMLSIFGPYGTIMEFPVGTFFSQRNSIRSLLSN